LGVKEYLTNVQTLNFWKRYFFDEKIINVTVENFYEAIIQEYFIGLIEPNVKKSDVEMNIETL
jgi:hypothetical protein